jgi:hypothetical protein
VFAVHWLALVRAWIVVNGLEITCLISRFIFREFSSKETESKKFLEELVAYFSFIRQEPAENDASSSSIVVFLFVAAVTFLPNRCLATI